MNYFNHLFLSFNIYKQRLIFSISILLFSLFFFHQVSSVQAQCTGTAAVCCSVILDVYKCDGTGAVCNPSSTTACSLNPSRCTDSGEDVCSSPTNSTPCSAYLSALTCPATLTCGGSDQPWSSGSCSWPAATNTPGPTNTPVPPQLCGGVVCGGSTPKCCGNTCVEQNASCITYGCQAVSCAIDQPLVPGANNASCPGIATDNGLIPVTSIDTLSGQITFDFQCPAGKYNWGDDDFGKTGLSVFKDQAYIGKIPDGSSSFTYTDPTAINNGASYYFIPYCVVDKGPWNSDPGSDFQKMVNSCSRNTTILPPPPSEIRGYKVKMPGNQTLPPVENQTVTLDPLTTNAQTTANPYTFFNIPGGLHTVTASLPAANYSVGYTFCYNSIGCHTSGYTLGNTVDVNSPPGGYTDLWWHYWEYDSWVRLKRASLHKQGGDWYNFIPPTVVPYDPYDTNQLMLDVDELDTGTARGAGLVTGDRIIDLGPNSATFSNGNYSKQNYPTGSRGFLDNLSSFIEYARARKDVAIVSNMTLVEPNRVNIIDHTIGVINDNIPGGADPIVVIVQGDIIINPSASGVFNSTRQSLVLISTGKITIEPGVKEVAAILIANEFNLGTSATPLKIVGNLVSANPVNTTVRARPVAEYQQPSVYIVFQPRFYQDALPYLSTVIQEGRQIQ